MALKGMVHMVVGRMGFQIRVAAFKSQLCLFLSFVLSFFLSFCFFIFERERESMSWGGAERERKTQNLKQAPGSELSALSPMAGLELTSH